MTTIAEQSELCAQKKKALEDAQVAIETASVTINQAKDLFQQAQQEFMTAMTQLKTMVGLLDDPNTPVQATATALGASLQTAQPVLSVENAAPAP